jgi:Cu-processing system ATP-binding protein
MNTLEVQGLRKAYGSQLVVNNVDLSVATGESLAIIGHNGAGKTTLMKLVLGLTRPTAGHIKFRSHGVDAANSIGFLPEVVSFPATQSGREMLRFYARLKNESNHQCDELLELVGLAPAAQQKIGSYSKGMRQRLGLAQALLGKPDLLLLDEPTSGLDPFLKRHFYEIISARQLEGTSVVISSHALTEIEARTDRIAIMKDGRILIQGSLAQLRQEAALPVHIVVKGKPGQAEELSCSLGAVPFERVGPDEWHIACGENEKLQLMHQLTSNREAMLDVIVRPPRLEDLYTHFVNGDGE